MAIGIGGIARKSVSQPGGKEKPNDGRALIQHKYCVYRHYGFSWQMSKNESLFSITAINRKFILIINGLSHRQPGGPG
ncbi:hypothetical protein [Serratia entomophila]|jgi:hypothetical protein|uniref:Uncharacterized protein n=1 Tax=Serratia entomophila TaxID=42906 RepID=A0ABY5CYE0_9GAMM|nr:hypothetical protein [Serratia entomophila]UIW20638.1 hypothetical protein KHA73_12190 [Serratia entomophila]USV03146.1 hypothetical protein KFQ06_11835 [Serratia entomophila]